MMMQRRTNEDDQVMVKIIPGIFFMREKQLLHCNDSLNLTGIHAILSHWNIESKQLGHGFDCVCPNFF